MSVPMKQKDESVLRVEVTDCFLYVLMHLIHFSLFIVKLKKISLYTRKKILNPAQIQEADGYFSTV